MKATKQNSQDGQERSDTFCKWKEWWRKKVNRMYWGEDKSNSPARKKMSKMCCWKKLKCKTKLTIWKKVNRHNMQQKYFMMKRKAAYLKNKEASKYVLPEKCDWIKPTDNLKQYRPQPLSPGECTLETRPTHHLKQDRPQSLSPEWCTLETRPTHKLKQDRPQSLSPEQCTLETRSTHCLKQDRPQSLSPEQYTLKTRLTHPLKQDRSQSLSPEQCTLETRPTHHLKQDRSQCHQNSAY